MTKTIRISAKCADLFSATAHDETGKQVGEYSGYVPSLMPGEHYGDYIDLNIDLATGKILNWKKPSASHLKIFRAAHKALKNKFWKLCRTDFDSHSGNVGFYKGKMMTFDAMA